MNSVEKTNIFELIDNTVSALSIVVRRTEREGVMPNDEITQHLIDVLTYGDNVILRVNEELYKNYDNTVKILNHIVLKHWIRLRELNEHKEQYPQDLRDFITDVKIMFSNIVREYNLKFDVIELFVSSIIPKEVRDNTRAPFRNNETRNLFEFIVKHWDNQTATKWGYIWEFLVTLNNGKLTTKTDYENYLREHHGFTKGKPNYDNCNSEKRFNELEELKKEYYTLLDLN